MGRVWREAREGRDGAIIISRIEIKKSEMVRIVSFKPLDCSFSTFKDKVQF